MAHYNTMIICRADAISRHYTSAPIFSDLSLQVESGERIGLVGPNGAGKSTLLRVLERREPPDSGVIHFHPEVSVAMLGQFRDYAPGETLRNEVRKAMRHLEDWYSALLEAGEKMASAPPNEIEKYARRYDHYQELLRTHGGYEFDHRVEEVLFGLHFSAVDFDRPLDTFSGGQQSRVELAKLLLSAPDLMLLDEPTNHLDIDTTEWLEDYLSRQPMSMVIVSHDRYFLDKTVNKIWEIHRGKLSVYSGNYQAYTKQRKERQKVADRQRAKQEETLAHYQDFVRKNSYGQLSKQANAREKMIEKLQGELVDTIGDISGPAMYFPKAARTGDLVLQTEGLSKRFTEALFADVKIEIERGQRVGVIGPNGAGKTTLMRILLGEEPASAGTVKLGQNVKIGYLDQDLALLDPDATPLDVVRPPWRVGEKAEPFRALLARFGIGADLAENRMGTLSGGERTRVGLARLCAYEVNLLALDEPTNHLDLWGCEALEAALAEFDGTLLVISHDRYFLNQVVDRLYYVADGKVKLIQGNYDRFQETREQLRAAAQAAATKADKAEKAEKAKNAPISNTKRKRKFPYRKTVDLEADIARHEQQIAELEAALVSPDVYKDGRRIRDINVQLEKLKPELERLLEHWEEAMELNG